MLADAECYRVTRSIAFVRALAHHGDAERAIAHGAATFKLDSPGPLPAGARRRFAVSDLGAAIAAARRTDDPDRILQATP